MKHRTPDYLCLLAFVGIMLTSCGQATDLERGEAVAVVSPVQVTTVQRTLLSDYTELSARSVYLQKSYVKANINGYVQSVYTGVGKQVRAYEVLFTLITKEARAIGNAVNQLDPTFKFSGISKIKAGQSGFVTLVNHQKGDYVQDGEALATISNQNSFVFLLELPYELHSVINEHQNVELTLPDGEKLSGNLGETLLAVDSVAQTQRIVITVKPSHMIPEGLVAKVKMIRQVRPDAQTLPKSAVLTNETEDEFWVMKLVNDSTAIKVPVKKGIENSQSIEILNPLFNPKDRIISVGNYGLTDTAKVKIVKQ